MKKIILSLLTLVLSVSVFAISYRDKATITLYDGAYFPNVIVGESDDTDFEGGVLVNGYYAPVQNLAGEPLAVYVYYKGEEYANLVLNSLTNVPLGIKTSSATSYHFYFAGITGTVKLYDKQEDEMITLNASTPYDFTIAGTETNSYINDRFYLFYDVTTFYPVTTNAYGFASYSYDENLALPAGLKAYKGALNAAGDELTLTEVADIPANTGVILYGAASTTYYLAPNATPAADMSSNILKASSDWTGGAENVFCLVGNELRQYTGATMPDNKAYLQLASAPSGAPRRIVMKFDNAQGVENVQGAAVEGVKFMENGQIFIRRGENVYNAQGQMVK